MVSFNLMFHLASALTLIGLAWVLLKMQAARHFQGQLWSALHVRRDVVYVDWPAKFFKKLTYAWQISLDWPANREQPQKIDLGVWARAHIELGITRISKQSERHLDVFVLKGDGLSEWEKRLETALHGHFTVHVIQSGEKA